LSEKEPDSLTYSVKENKIKRCVFIPTRKPVYRRNTMSEAEMSSESSGDASRPEDVINLANTPVNCVEAETVRLNQCSVGKVEAQSIDFDNGGVQTVHSQNLNFKNGGILVAHSEMINLSNGGIGVASSQESTVNGNTGILVTQSANVNQGQVGLLIARDVQGTKIKSIVMLASDTHAPVETIVDQRSVALFGLAAGVAMGLVFSLFRFLKGR